MLSNLKFKHNYFTNYRNLVNTNESCTSLLQEILTRGKLSHAFINVGMADWLKTHWPLDQEFRFSILGNTYYFIGLKQNFLHHNFKTSSYP